MITLSSLLTRVWKRKTHKSDKQPPVGRHGPLLAPSHPDINKNGLREWPLNRVSQGGAHETSSWGSIVRRLRREQDERGQKRERSGLITRFFLSKRDRSESRGGNGTALFWCVRWVVLCGPPNNLAGRLHRPGRNT